MTHSVVDHAGVAAVAIVMGLNLLELLPLRLPSLDVDVRTLQVPPILQVSITRPSFTVGTIPETEYHYCPCTNHGHLPPQCLATAEMDCAQLLGWPCMVHCQTVRT